MDISATFAPAFQETESLEIDLLTETVLRTFSSSFTSLSIREMTRKRKKKKNFRKYLEDMLESSYLCTRFSRRGWRWVGFLDRGGAKNFFFFYLPFAKRDDEKKKKEKNFWNYLEDILKSSYLCIRFLKRKAVLKRSDLWRIYINNTSSTRAGASQINN